MNETQLISWWRGGAGGDSELGVLVLLELMGNSE